MVALAPSTRTLLFCLIYSFIKETESIIMLFLSKMSLYFSNSAISLFRSKVIPSYLLTRSYSFSSCFLKESKCTKSPTLTPFLKAFEEYVGPIPLLVVPRKVCFFSFWLSCSSCTWVTRWARSEMNIRFL